MKKSSIIIALIASLVLSTNIANAYSSVSETKNNIIIIDKDYSTLSKESLGEDILKSNNILSYTENEKLNSNTENIYVINVDTVNNNNDIRKKANNLVTSNEKVYLYGEDLKVSEIEDLLTISINELDNKNTKNDIDIQEESWNVIGIENGTAISFAHIQSYDYDNNKIAPILENYIDTIVSSENRINELNEQSIQSFGAGDSSTIVDSGYNIKDVLYTNDAWGNSILRSTLLADYILYKNNNDTDPTYDYFLIKNNTQLYTNRAKAANGYKLVVKHSLPNSGVDNITDWGPHSSRNDSTFSLSYPLGVSWSFSAGDSVDITTTENLSADYVQYVLTNTNWIFGNYPLANDYITIQPGTSWSSAGRSAVINTNAYAEVEVGTTTYILAVAKNVRYTY